MTRDWPCFRACVSERPSGDGIRSVMLVGACTAKAGVQRRIGRRKVGNTGTWKAGERGRRGVEKAIFVGGRRWREGDWGGLN